jgi:hypothetical protein
MSPNQDPPPEGAAHSARRRRGTLSSKLYRMLQDVEEESRTSCHLSHGAYVWDSLTLCISDEILPKYFSKQNQVGQLCRRLNLSRIPFLNPFWSRHMVATRALLERSSRTVPFHATLGASSKKISIANTEGQCTGDSVRLCYAMKPILPRQERVKRN